VVWAPAAARAELSHVPRHRRGLVVERPLQRRFRPWAAISGYTLTDDALVCAAVSVVATLYRCDRADIDDVDAVVTALDDEIVANDGAFEQVTTRRRRCLRYERSLSETERCVPAEGDEMGNPTGIFVVG